MEQKERFWQLETAEEMRLVDAVLRRRFPHTYAVLAQSLEDADPLDLSYPGNPGEYGGIIRELLVLLAPVSGDLSRLTRSELTTALRMALARGYGEPAEEDRLQRSIDLITSERNPRD